MRANKTQTGRRRALRLLAAGGLSAIAAPLLSGRALARTEDAMEKSGRDALAVMHSRRSHRSFTGAPVTDGDLDRILAAAMQAPSAHDTRPWEFIIVRSRDTVRRLVTLIPSLLYVEKAGALIVNCVNARAGAAEARETNLMGMACCSMNMLLAAEALGYGAVWIDLICAQGDRPGVFRRLLELPEQVEPFNMVALGLPAMRIPKENRFDAKRIHLDKWGD